jgi:catechol 2,3-dioxygenase-like lactoylglutathione lyase family enzyme
MNILGIEGITYGVTDRAACVRYLEDWGFTRSGSGPHPRFVTAEGTWIELRPHDDAALPPLRHASPFFTGSCAREVVWGVDSPSTLDALAEGLARDREVTRDAQGTLHTTDAGGNPIGLCVTRRVALQPSGLSVNVPGAAARIDRQSEGAHKGALAPPLRINHVVYLAPDPDASREFAAFYQERLGFRLSENLGGSGFFLRAGGSRDHHNLLVECFAPGQRGVQHVAYEFRDFDQIMHRGTHLEAQGWRSHIGPGRHTLGSNFTWYFWSPLGGLMELVADMDQLTESWQPRFIDPKKAGPPFAWLARPNPPGFRFGHDPR